MALTDNGFNGEARFMSCNLESKVAKVCLYTRRIFTSIATFSLRDSLNLGVILRVHLYCCAK